MSGTLSIGGLVSGLDTDGLISKLQAVAQTPVTNLQTKKSTLQAKYNAWNDLNTRLLAVKESANALSTLRSKASTSISASDTTHLYATTSDTAVPGTYAFTVDQLSTFNQYVSQGFTDQDTTVVGTGTLTIGTGSGSDAKSTTITASNLTLAGLRDAINQADVGVSAYIVQENDTSYRLVLNAQQEGTDGAITVTNDLTGTGALTLTEAQQAQDTVLHFGTGETAVTVTRSGNTLTDVIPGVSLTLNSGIEDTSVTFTVSRSYGNIQQAVIGFATQYNNLLDYINAQQKFDATTNATGTLFGEFQLNQIKSDLASTVMSTVANLPSSLSSVDQVGITTGDGGQLVVDASALDAALRKDFDGVMRLFGAGGTSATSELQYQGSTTDTKSSSASGYAVQITQAAAKARLTLGTETPATTTADETLIINGKTIAVTAGMTRLQLLAAINAMTDDTGLVASLTASDGTGAGTYLTLTQQSYGASQHINVVSTLTEGGLGIGSAALTEHSAGGVAGKDVAGSINGVAATGAGQVLTVDDSNAKGLSLIYTGTATGTMSPIVFQRGIGAMLQVSLGYLTDTSGNQGIALTEASLQKQMDAIDAQITRTTSTINSDMARIRKQFNAMEVALNKLQNQSSQLASYISSMSSTSSSSSSS